MNRYRASFRFAAWVVSIPCVFLLAVNVYNVRLDGVMLLAGLLALWWGLDWGLMRDKKPAFIASLAVATLFWALLFIQTIRRLAFIVGNDALEGPGGHGSPVGFLLGLAMEQIFFVPLSIVLASAVVGLVKREIAFRPAPQ